MEKKQSSIDWFVQKIWKNEPLEHEQKVIEQAKAMHRQEIQYTYWEGGMDKPKGSKECEQYYNETFGGEQC